MTIPLTIATFHPFEPAVIWLLALAVVLFCISALMSGAETALFSLSPSDMASIRKRRARSDNAILRLHSSQDYMLAAILIVNNLVNILIILLSNRIIDSIVTFTSAGWQFAVKTIVVTFMLLLFSEILPKIYSAYNPLGMARMIAVPLVGVMNVCRPFSWLLIHSGGLVSNMLAKKRGNVSIDELSGALEITRTKSDDERRLLSGIVNFVNTDVGRIMRPRVDMTILDEEDDFQHVKQVIIDSGYSRLPVYGRGIDNIAGVLYVKDLVAHTDKGADFAWQGLLRKPYFVHEGKKINDLLEEFRATRVHLAIVVDEYGSTVGLVTLEDILEEIVGEISDESDAAPEAGYRRVNENTYDFEGKTRIEDMLSAVCRKPTLLDEVRGPAETVAGLMVEVKGDFPAQGEVMRVPGMRLTATVVNAHRIEQVRVVLDK